MNVVCNIGALAMFWASVEMNSGLVQTQEAPWGFTMLCFINLQGQTVSILLVFCLFVIG